MRLAFAFSACFLAASGFAPPTRRHGLPRLLDAPAAVELASAEEKAASISSPEERSQKAKQTWSTVALQPTTNVKRKEIDLKSSIIYNQKSWDEFCTMKGTYYINGLASCQIGDRLIHPFEAHGFTKSLVFDGKGKVQYTSNIVNTPLTEKERNSNKIINRGVMSTVASMDSILGKIQNALLESGERREERGERGYLSRC